MRPIFCAWEANDTAMWQRRVRVRHAADFGRAWIADSDSLQLLLGVCVCVCVCVFALLGPCAQNQNAWH